MPVATGRTDLEGGPRELDRRVAKGTATATTMIKRACMIMVGEILPAITTPHNKGFTLVIKS